MPNLSHTRFIVVFVPMLLLTACAGVTRVPLDKDASSKLTNVESRIMIPADEIIVRAKASNISAAMGGGLIPALIDASVTKSRQTELEKIATPFYDKTDSIDFRTVFSDAFKANINDQKSLPAMNLSVSTRGFSKSALDEKKTKLSAGEGFMGMRIWYEFTSDLRSIIVAADTWLVTNDKADYKYKNTFVYLSKPVEEANPLGAWAQDNGKTLAETFAESAKQIAVMLKQDLEAPTNEILFASLAKQEKTKVVVPTYPLLGGDGYLLEQSDQRKTVRLESGIVYSVPK
ncbi:MAG TPA: hypothetical protein VK974_09590 [Methylophilaceae bacterium]|nr:hypothetical protein [Methylophilaceae bacterium]